MAGHSKWAKVKHFKGAIDAKRSKLFGKIAKEIMIAVKMGSSGDPDMNPRLRMALLKARMASMPRDNIERAIKKASGEGAAVSYEDLVYEVYGPSGVAILIELSTDNRNRTSAEIRAILTRHNGSMATSGAVSRLFQKKGQFIIEREAADEDKLMEVAMNAGAEDFKSEPEGYEIITEPGDFEAVSKALDEAGITCANASITQLPTMVTPVAPDMVETVQKLIDALEDQDDVQEVFTNADM
ncbi:MAG: YebC/PmpR family DNA-binding transcriptional regulator [Verrucomicrobia bacterium]|nr:YebC/PmpR family DNA-binding transcriptional regulator [Verrucomicrobiota bacterium]